MMQQPLLIVKFSLLVAASAPVLLAAAAGDYSLTDEICDENPPESIPNRNDSYKADALCGTHRQIHRIAGGFSARIGHFPSFVQLHFYHRGQKLPTQCGGTIVGSDLVLTAAHCVGDARTITRIRAIAVWVRGEGVIMPFDIALVIVKEPFRFDDFVQPACYPTVDVDNSYQAFAVGFGYTNPEGSPTRVQPDLLQALPVVRQANCSIFHPPVPKGSVCYKANLPQYSGSTCKVDSGGPVYVIRHDNLQAVAGIILGGGKQTGCRAGQSLPFVTMDVSSSYPLIRDMLNSCQQF